jgi:hypothetical protein
MGVRIGERQAPAVPQQIEPRAQVPPEVRLNQGLEQQGQDKEPEQQIEG